MTDTRYLCRVARASKASLPKSNLNEIDIELSWIQNEKDNVDFLNAAMKHHSILFKVQRREFVRGGSN